MAQHPNLEISGAIVSGGWYFESESLLIYNVTKRLHVSQDGILLRNNSDPKNVCPM